jgi:diguanylate cyclase (GGDEF)-like protein
VQSSGLVQKIALLYDASQAVISTFDLDEVLARILGILQNYFHLRHVAILLLDPDTNELRVRCHMGWNDESLQTLLKPGTGLIGAAAQQRRPIYSPDVTKDPRYISTIPSTKSEIAVPLVVRNEVVGVLDCQSESANSFDAETIDLLTLFSTQASIAIQNARLYSLEQRKAAQLEAINLIARQTTAVLEIDELMQKVCTLVLKAFPVDHAVVLLLEDGNLIFRAHHGKFSPRFTEGQKIPLHEGVCARAIESGKPVLENNVVEVQGYIPGFSETRSEVCIPLVSFGETMGVLSLESAKVNAFDASDLPSLESVADICANAIQNTRYFEKIRHMAYVDGLTGLFNRRYFEKVVQQEIERAQRYQGAMSVVMFDIDQFKRLNDEFGHLLGDDVLRQVSTLFSQNLRKIDIACRFGGEEFAVIVPETTGDHAFSVADKLRKVIAQTAFLGVARPITVTAGVASYPVNGITRDELVRAADEALYAGKQAGRNTVVTSDSILK